MNKIPVVGLVSLICLFGTAPSAQTYSYPISSSLPKGTCGLLVHDRYGLPIAKAIATIHSQTEALFHWSDNARELRTITGETDEAGRLDFAVNGVVSFAVIQKPGYAPLMAYPLFEGCCYELSLDLGCPAILSCVTPDGHAVPGATIELKWFTGLQSRIDPLQQRVLWSGQDGALGLDFLPRGQIEVIGRATGLFARRFFGVYSAFGRELDASRGNITLIFSRLVSTTISPRSRASGDSVPGAKCYLMERSNPPAQRLILGGDDGRLHLSRPLGSELEAFVFADGFEGERISLVGEQLPEIEVQMTPLDSDAIVLDLADSALAGRRIVRPVVMADGPNWDWIEVDSSPILVPKRVDVFAAVLHGDEVEGFLCRNKQEVRILSPGTIDVTYSVDGRKPYGVLVRCGWDANQLGAPRPSEAFTSTLTGITDNKGVLHMRGLVPGAYYLEPHMHHTVFQDSVRRVRAEVSPTEPTDVCVRGGLQVSGTVVCKKCGVALGYGNVTAGSGILREHAPIFPVDAAGGFVLTGLVEGIAYKLFYDGTPWASGPEYRPIAERPLAVGVGECLLPQEEPVVIRAEWCQACAVR